MNESLQPSYTQHSRSTHTDQETRNQSSQITAQDTTSITPQEIIDRYTFTGNPMFSQTLQKANGLRIWCHNLDTLGKKHPDKILDELILANEAKVDIILWQDPMITPTLKDTLIATIQKTWGGDHMQEKLWTGSQDMPESIKHGIWVLIHSRWAHRIKE